MSKKLSVALVIIFISIALPVTGQPLKPAEIELKVTELLARMTLEEKVGQLVQYSYDGSTRVDSLIRLGLVGSYLNLPPETEVVNRLQKIAVTETRLGIPLIIGFDVIHGLRTIFPIPLAESCSWDPQLAEKTARVAAREAAAGGIHWTFAPMVDIARDPRWGRIAEGAGEDPFLGAAFARARVKGFQGADLTDPETIVACAKHYVAYGAAEGGRDYNTVDISEKTLREIYLPPFKAALDAGVGTFMSSFNEINGIPGTGNHFTLTKILRQEWGFEGFVVSDWNSIGELLNHGVVANPPEAARLALFAGVDLDMQGNIYFENLVPMVRNGLIPEAWVDTAVKRILRIKFKIGLFERPYTDPSLAQKVILSKEHLQLAREAAQKSIVLLKNEKQILPLSKQIKSLAVMGPLADNQAEALGCWSGRGEAEDVVSVLQGIKNKVASTTKITHASGCEIDDLSRAGFPEALKIAASAEAVIVVLGESVAMSGEAGSRAKLELPGVQEALLKELVKTNPKTILVLKNGRPLAIHWAAENVPAIIEAWQLGLQHGNAVADVLFGDFNPSGKLTASFPRVTGQVPIYYNHKNTGRPPVVGNRFSAQYVDIPFTPLFPFGYGLSYTSFEYSDLQLSAMTLAPYSTLTVNVNVKNSGKRAGDEIVQLYLRDRVASLTRPVKELKGFQRISLAAGATKTVQFTLGADHWGMYNQQMEWVVEPGEFDVWVGPHSQEGLEQSFRIE